MDLVRDSLKSFLQRYYVLENKNYHDKPEELIKFINDRRNASLGDSIINFIYSCSKSMAREECTGIKVSDEILLKGYNSSKLASWLHLPGKKKDKANAIEALIFFIWLNYDFSIEEMALNLLSKMKIQGMNLNNEVEEKRIAGQAFTQLFDTFNELLLQQK